MIPGTFKAIRAEEDQNKVVSPVLKEVPIRVLPEHGILIKVHYTSLNYKDALSSTGNRGVTRNFPHTPGIDSCGTVVSSSSPEFKEGDAVVVCGYDLGMNTPGGFGQYIRVPADWVMPIPNEMSFRESMMLGTAGFTAGLGIYKMELNGQKPENGPILVTGAGGGLGGLAINILAKSGYQVIAATGKTSETEYFKQLGVTEIIDRDQVNDTGGKLLLKQRWAGVVETVGGNILATAIKACQRHGNVAVCGNALSYNLETNVYPFILNGINLLGVDSATCPMKLRRQIWDKLAGEWKPPALDLISHEIKLDQLTEYIALILKGKIRGRMFVNMID